MERWGTNYDVQYIKYNQETIYSDLQKFDICVLPKGSRPRDKYKSENKTVISEMCGIPVVSSLEELEFYQDAQKRNLETEELREMYDCRVSVQEYKDLIESI